MTNDLTIRATYAEDSLICGRGDVIQFDSTWDDFLNCGGWNDTITRGNGEYSLLGGLGDDLLKGDRGSAFYVLTSSKDIIDAYSI